MSSCPKKRQPPCKRKHSYIALNPKGEPCCYLKQYSYKQLIQVCKLNKIDIFRKDGELKAKRTMINQCIKLSKSRELTLPSVPVKPKRKKTTSSTSTTRRPFPKIKLPPLLQEGELLDELPDDFIDIEDLREMFRRKSKLSIGKSVLQKQCSSAKRSKISEKDIARLQKDLNSHFNDIIRVCKENFEHLFANKQIANELLNFCIQKLKKTSTEELFASYHMCRMGIYSDSTFRKWSRQNHPDRGGDANVFATVSNWRDRGWFCGRSPCNQKGYLKKALARRKNQ